MARTTKKPKRKTSARLRAALKRKGRKRAERNSGHKRVKSAPRRTNSKKK
jgi:hypothetical protein